MAENSKIEWTHHTANLWWGCEEVHAGCDNCYARTLAQRWGKDVWGNDRPRLLIKSVWADLDKYQRLAKKANEVHRVFVGSMMDIFEKSMPLVDAKGNRVIAEAGIELSTHHLRFQLFQNISDGMYPNLLLLLLTKRPSNTNKYIPERWKSNPPANVMFGYSAVDNQTYKLVDHLRKVNGKRFLSVEPQIEGIYQPDLTGIDWVIQGGESGAAKDRRPFDLQWAYSMRDSCFGAGVPYFFKQIDQVQAIPADLLIREFPNTTIQ